MECAQLAAAFVLQPGEVFKSGSKLSAAKRTAALGKLAPWLFGTYVAAASCWAGARVYLQISEIRNSP
jgi:hypothetical protein